MSSNDVLELSAIAPERGRARLRTSENPEGLRPDGSEYELTTPEDLSVVQLQEMLHSSREMHRLWGAEKVSDAEQKRLERMLNDAARLLVRGATATDIAALPGIAKQQLVLSFLGRLNRAMGPLNETAAEIAKGLEV